MSRLLQWLAAGSVKGHGLANERRGLRTDSVALGPRSWPSSTLQCGPLTNRAPGNAEPAPSGMVLGAAKAMAQPSELPGLRLGRIPP